MHYSIIDNEAGNIIEQAKTIVQAQKIIAEYEAADKKDGTYTPNFYSIRLTNYCAQRARIGD